MRLNTARRVLLAALYSLAAMPAIAADAIQTPETLPERWSLAERPTLTNDWFDAGPSLRASGLDVRLEWAQFYQGMPVGDGDHSWQYGGQFSLLAHLDLSKMGLWDGLTFTVQGLSNYGNSVNGFGGALLFVNSTLGFPGIEGDDRSDLATLYFTQQFGDLVSVSLGKIYTVELARAKPLVGGGGADTFWNMNFASTLTGVVPAQINGARIKINTKPINYSVMIYDSQDATNKPLFSDLFENGVTVNVTATLPTQFGGKAGYYGLRAIYSTREGTDFSMLNVPPGTPTGTKQGSWFLGVTFQQYLYQDAADPKRGWGVFGEISRADGNPNALEWSTMFGIAGSSLFASRPDDRFGIGYFYTGTSKVLKDELAPFVKLGDESGLEVFYNVAVTPWFRVMADLQFLNTATPGFSNSVFAGVGMYVKF